MYGGQNSESPAVAYSAAVYIATRSALHEYCEAVSTEQSQQTQTAVSAAAVGLR